ncbi:Cytochrome b/b6, N-terminal [Acididesulfobacillus acetoxydans]|uniref:Cytochrome b/b6, N-terminal n=1 Tax=Acididesulfobacillus acetoxydans TaxID=1561005 RepID=A0A8S0X5G0_9FIRM|nr:cytochrome bc complex cytochrome b subunit [Acididesulfobacillus acetoxydans]CAA7601610.1 Cytochrome b/b6, N-terminal [Acididesulfobacillus acetoxydans]CEJ07097.1 Cytochrome b6 [Acididesulfobacillus acetoxydans]
MKGWLDERLHTSSLLQALFAHPVPKRSNFLDYLGFATFFAFINQAVTGILLATVYHPSASGAYASIQTLQNSVAGHFVRSLHSWGANFMVVLVGLHLLRVFFAAAYKRPRELTWVMGGILLIATLGLAFTGYLLPWDQKGYWATTVGTAMAGYVPIVGDFLVRLLRDGTQVTGATLTRFYSVHMLVLPALLLLAFLPHFFFVLRQGMASTDELREAEARGEDVRKISRPFWPDVALRMAAFVLLVGAALWLLAFLYPKGLGAAADPLNKAHFTPEPAWYFFGIYQLLKYFPGKLDGLAMVGLPLIGIVILFSLPWLDRNSSRRAKRRPLALGLAGILVLGLGFLTYQGMNSVPKALAGTGIIAQPSYSKDIQPILHNSCLQCHANIATYSGTLKRVTPGNPQASLLYQHITGSVQPQMPFGQPPLPKTQIQTIKNWIREGAKNN